VSRPEFEHIKTCQEFTKWYWLKTELVEICKKLSLPRTGRKFDLRDRIIDALDNKKPQNKKVQRSAKSTFNWAKSNLTLETIITDSVSFGPNFRSFMHTQIGKKFKCHSDFMDWVKSNEGKTLKDAVETWHLLEKRKEDDSFQRTIAPNNMLAQYTRDFLRDNKGCTISDVKKYWNEKKRIPTQDGFIRYEKSDLDLIK